MMSDELRARLLEAAEAGEVLRVAYHGGSQPGTAREIVPLVVGDRLVMADDCATDALRAFRIDLLELLAPGAPAPAYEVGRQAAVEPEPTIPECFEPARDALVRIGWHVEIEPRSVTLHRFLKNGRPKKSPDVVLWFSPTITESFDDFDGRGMQTIERPSKRPYGVSGLNMPNTPTFTKLARAAETFWKQARLQAPGVAPPA